jgi:hypothetical protein
MHRLRCHMSVDRGTMRGRRASGPFASISIILDGLTYLALLSFAQPSRVDAEQLKLVGLTSGPLSVETFGRACPNCHIAIHGSNSPSGPLLQR